MAKGHRTQIREKEMHRKIQDLLQSYPTQGVSVQKACFVLDAIRGKDVTTALAILEYNPRYASSLIKKLLESAIANAENNNGMNRDNLYIAECYANKGPTMKRIHPRAQGRAYRIEKRKSHITLVLDENNLRREMPFAAVGPAPRGRNERRKYGQKVNPHGLRVGVIKDWDSRWYAESEFSDFLVEDYNIRKFLKKKLYSAGVSKIEIERASDRVKVILYTAKPGVVIGKGGAEIEATRKELSKLTDKKVLIDIKEIKRPDRDAQLVAENIAQQLENRVSFRRAMKSCMGRTMKAGALGIKTAVAGRLGGADIARTEFYSEGTIPLQTLRADIDYGFAEADTTYGKLGVKVWIYKGEVLPAKGNSEGKKTSPEGSDK